jgi:hypothetical protein
MGIKTWAVVCALCGVVALGIACASGGDADYGAFGDDGGGETSSGSSGASGSGGSSGTASSGSGSGSSGASGSGGTPDSSSSSGGGDGGGSSGDDGGGTGDGAGGDGGGNAACGVSPDQCAAGATSLGSVAGDQSGSPVGESGYTSEWLRLDLTEQDSSVVGHAMIFTAELTSPPGMNYDLYAYRGNSIGDIQCANPTGQSTNTTGTDQVTFQWGETTGGIANGKDDSATVMIEVRWVSGACTNTQNWSLSAHGD